MEIITKGIPDDDQVMLDEAIITYVQNPDCTEDRDGDWQKLTISIRDNGVAKFLNLKSNNWSFDSVESLCDILKDYCKRIEYE